MTHLVTYRDISENLSETFRKHRKEQGGFCGWSGNEFEDIQKGFQLAAQESKESLRIRTPHRRNKSAITRPLSQGSQPKKSSSASSIVRQQSMQPSVRAVQFQFEHFEQWEDHIEHYRSTVTERIQHKYVEHNAQGQKAKRRGTMYENCDTLGKKLLGRQEMLSPTFRYSNTAFGAKRSLGDNQAKRQVKMTTIMPEITPHRLPNHRNEISFTRDDETAQALFEKSHFFNQIFHIEHVCLNI